MKASVSRAQAFGQGSTAVQLTVRWTLTCTAGDGNCKGEVDVHAPEGATFLKQGGKVLRPAEPAVIHVTCAGPCTKTTTGNESFEYVTLTRVMDDGPTHSVPVEAFTPKGRAGRTFHIRLSPSCPLADIPAMADPDGFVALPLSHVVVVSLTFDKEGRIDYARSDLNGDGKPDGAQTK